MNEQPEKLTGTSLDITAENRARLKALFPACFTETKNDKGELVESIDLERLKAELGTFSDVFESRRERYGMDWPGKKDVLSLIQKPSHATLKPCREESVNFDNTENLFIEGDNLEVLKLLQKSYYGKIKMIYIDPPYNTGKEFIYPDNYTESLETYLEYAGLIDGEGKKFSTNTANEGRFHTKWLNMMYPRLYLARNLLRDDGVIFISIDDNEVSNLRKICDEIFGEENFVGCAGRITKKSNNKGDFWAPNFDYLLTYTKNITCADPFFGGVNVEAYDQIEKEEGPYKGERYQLVRLYMSTIQNRNPEQRFWIDCPDGSRVIPPGKTFPPERPILGDGIWRWTKSKFDSERNRIVIKAVRSSNLITDDGSPAKWNVYTKTYLKDVIDNSSAKTNSFIEDHINQIGSHEINSLGIPFDYSKPSTLIKYLMDISKVGDNDIVLDFFAGSATTAHAVLDLNKQDGGNRKFILVQLPEPCTEDSEAFKAGYKNIADIGKERIRRVIKNINEKQSGKLDLEQSANQDLGFKVFKLDKSNFRQWQPLDSSTPPEKVEEELFKHINHIDAKASPEDLLYEILLKAGFTPTEKIEIKTIAGKKVFSVSDGALLLCLEDEVTMELINAVAELEPMQFICLDAAFHGNDQLKANAVQTFAARNMQKEKHNQIVFMTV
jgi:adenine-specific DNA-methyltransferase